MKKLWLLLMLAVIVGCEDGVDPEITEEGIDIEALAADPNVEFIYFESGDDFFLFDTERFSDGFSNTYIREDTPDYSLDQLNINMTTDPIDKYSCNIYISHTRFTERNLPLVINNGSTQGHAEIQLDDNFTRVQPTYGPDDIYNFVGASLFNEFRIVIESFDNNVIAGTFSGTMRTRDDNSSKEMEVKNGRYRIKIRVD